MQTIICDSLQIKHVETVVRKILLQLPDHRLRLIPLLLAYRRQRRVPAIACVAPARIKLGIQRQRFEYRYRFALALDQRCAFFCRRDLAQ